MDGKRRRGEWVERVAAAALLSARDFKALTILILQGYSGIQMLQARISRQ